MTRKQLGILILACAFGVIMVYLLPVFLGPGVFGQNLFGALNLMVVIVKLWWWILFSTLAIAIVLSVIFKIKGKPLQKIWVSAGLIIGVAFLLTMFLTLLSTSALYQGMGVR